MAEASASGIATNKKKGKPNMSANEAVKAAIAEYVRPTQQSYDESLLELHLCKRAITQNAAHLARRLSHNKRQSLVIAQREFEEALGKFQDAKHRVGEIVTNILND